MYLASVKNIARIGFDLDHLATLVRSPPPLREYISLIARSFPLDPISSFLFVVAFSLFPQLANGKNWALTYIDRGSKPGKEKGGRASAVAMEFCNSIPSTFMIFSRYLFAK